MARGADDLVMLEFCAIHKVISYPDFIQITQVLNVSKKRCAKEFCKSNLLSFALEQNMDKVTEPRLDPSQAMLSAQVDPELMNKYTPSYRPNIQYNFSDKAGFQTAMRQVTEAEAKRALRTLVDFMKTEVAERDQGLAYEPLFSQLISNKDKFLV